MSPPQRVSPVIFPDSYTLPGRPETNAAAPVQDAFRQTQFVLTDDLRLFAEGANLQLEIARDASGSRHRTHPLTAILALWSRAFSAGADAMLLVTRGSYSSVPALARTAAECVAAQDALRAGEMEIYLDWVENALTVNEDHKAMEYGLGRYFAGETLAASDRLRAVYRPVSDLGRPNFGASLLLTGSESNRTRVQIAFADQAFHLGWAQVTLGWLLSLCGAQLGVAQHARGIVEIGEGTRLRAVRWVSDSERLLAQPDRCSIAEIESNGERRYLVENFRRAPGAAPKRVLL